MIPYYCKDSGVKTRAAILVHRSINNSCWEIHQFTTPDLIAIKYKHDDREVILASMYMDYNESIQLPKLADLIKYAEKLKVPLLIGADTNSHHKLWGNKDNNARGEELLDFLNAHHLSWENRGSTPTFVNSRGHESIIDLTITNSLGRDLVSDWHVSPKYSNSDHSYIMYNITSNQKVTPKQVRLVGNTDWDIFHEYLETNHDTLTSLDSSNSNPHDLDKACQQLNKHLVNAFEAACPITYISNHIKKPPWMTPEVMNAQKGMRSKLKLARTSKSDADWNAFRDSNKVYNKLLRKTRQSEWRNFCKNTDSVKESARMNKILKSCSSKKEKLEAVYKSDNTLTTSANETLEVMMDKHFKCDPILDSLFCAINNSQHNPTTLELIKKIYTPERLERAVMSFDPNKAAGPDSLKPIIIQKAWHKINNIARDIMICSHVTNHIPAPWQEVDGIFLPKPGKTDYNQHKSFRTISLSCVLLKSQEKVILWHMQHDLGMAECLNKKQFGFRTGSSTETALHKVVRTIERRMAKKGFVLGTFLDIEGAFDNVSFKAISEAIRNSPVDNTTSGWIISMITNRYITINHKDATKRVKVCRGCPQGGVLSPFLWNLVVDDLLNYSATHIPGYLQAFADDLMSLAEGNDTEVIWQRTQKTIDTIERWCETKGLNISALKTKIVMFTWNRKWTLRPITTGGITILPTDSVKLLGVTLDSKLNFNQHISNITTKAIKSLMQCNRAVGPTWGLSPKVCKWLYISVIRPMLSYGVVVWARALYNNSNLRKLDRVQGMALRIMAGAFPSTPFSALNYLTNIPDINSYLHGEAAKGAARLQSYGDWTVETAPTGKGVIRAHSTISNEFLADLNLPMPVMRDLIKPTLLLDRTYTISLPDSSNLDSYRNSLEERISLMSENDIFCYTDGSLTDKGVGGGFLTTTNNSPSSILTESSFKLNDYCSVFQAEIMALQEGANSLLNHCNKTVTFWSDSLSALQALSNKLIKSRTVLNCHRALSELAVHNQVYLRWIAAHSGHWGNERADMLAKTGTTCDRLLTSYMPQTFIKTAINTKVRELSKTKWDSNPHAHTKFVLGVKHEATIKTLNKNFINNRVQYRMAVHLITGHTGLNKHLHTMKLVDSSGCPNCGCDEETVAHFIGQCPRFAQKRAEYFATYYSSINDIFEHNTLSKIISYTLNTKRFKIPEDYDESGVT